MTAQETQAFNEVVKETMIEIAKPFIRKKFTGANRKTFFEIICSRACLNKDSETVQEIFDATF